MKVDAIKIKTIFTQLKWTLFKSSILAFLHFLSFGILVVVDFFVRVNIVILFLDDSFRFPVSVLRNRFLFLLRSRVFSRVVLSGELPLLNLVLSLHNCLVVGSFLALMRVISIAIIFWEDLQVFFVVVHWIEIINV